MAKTNHNSFKCNLCGEDSINPCVNVKGFSIANGRRFKRAIGNAQIHVCKKCIKVLTETKCCCGKR